MPTASPRAIVSPTSRNICTRAAPRPRLRSTPRIVDCGKAHRVGIPEGGSPSYGHWRGFVQALARGGPACALPPRDRPQARALRLVALGDSLTAGYGLPPGKAFPDQLEAALQGERMGCRRRQCRRIGRHRGRRARALRLGVPADANALIVELGANDMLRGQSPDDHERGARGHPRQGQGRAFADAHRRHARRAQSRRAITIRRFDAIYPQLAASHGTTLYPFFLDGVAGDAKLNQPDGMHPTAAGVAVIVSRILPAVEDLLRGRSGEDRACAGLRRALALP